MDRDLLLQLAGEDDEPSSAYETAGHVALQPRDESPRSHSGGLAALLKLGVHRDASDLVCIKKWLLKV